jgi:2-polyprenyl-3-methyl-5-hydroxy-6-metoxy-1,4-benzoquinol methylase
MITLTNCPLCESPDFIPYLLCKDYTVSQENFNIVVCQKCDFKFTNPRPDDNEIGAYYQSETYISHSDTNQGLINKIYQGVRKFTLKSKLNLINKLVDKMETGNHEWWFSNRLLDIGCGTGMFLKVCKENGWLVTGTEPDDNTRKKAIEHTNAIISPDFMSLPDHEFFDVITLWHVLEHISDLKAGIKKLNSLLSANGFLIVAVPNHTAYDAQKYQQYWAAYDVPRHLSHFSPKNIEHLFSENGMKLVCTKPLWFDAFYIAMISTSYKKGIIDYFEAFWQGMLSNMKARKNGNYSSLIYIIKKV